MYFNLFTQIGIALNFVAGFLLAPQLIGVKRLLYWEQTLRDKSKSTVENIKKQENSLFLVLFLSLLLPYSTLKRNQSKDTEPFIKNIKGRFWFVCFLIVAILLQIPIALITLVLGFVGRRLENKKSLQGILVVAGIVFFILGNCLQFIGSFKP